MAELTPHLNQAAETILTNATAFSADPSLTAWTVLTATGALLAFLVGLYTLVGRERKSPYLINSVFKIFLLCLMGIAFDILSALSLLPSPWNACLLKAGLLILFAAIVVTIWRLWTIFIRLSYFVDVGFIGRLRDLAVIRFAKAKWRAVAGTQTYEHDPIPLSGDLLSEVKSIIASNRIEKNDPDGKLVPGEAPAPSKPTSLALALGSLGQSDMILGQLALAFLKSNNCVQYMTASRHPIEFIQHLKSIWPENGESWKTAAARVVAIDAYTPHFGFIDSINAQKSTQLTRDFGVECLTSRETYAGMHSASSAAFKLIKKKAQKSVRQPILVIYEDSHALTDHESAEQYRIFVRHVIPSERLWDGMFTVFAETAQSDSDWKLLSAYASLTLDLRKS